MEGSKLYLKYRNELEEIQFLAYTIPQFLEYQKKLVSTLKNRHNGGPNHEFYQNEKLFDVYEKKDYEGIMAKQLLFSLYAQFEILVNGLLKEVIIRRYEGLEDLESSGIEIVGLLDSSNNKSEFILKLAEQYIEKITKKTIREKLSILYKAVPVKLYNADDVRFEEIDYYYVIRNIFLHNNGVVNEKAVKRAQKYFTIDDIGKVIRINLEEYEKVFELLSSVGCSLAEIVDNMSVR